MSEKQKFIRWFNREKKKGMIGMNFFWANPSNLKGMDEELIYKEINECLNAPTVPDPDVLGRHSL